MLFRSQLADRHQEVLLLGRCRASLQPASGTGLHGLSAPASQSSRATSRCPFADAEIKALLCRSILCRAICCVRLRGGTIEQLVEEVCHRAARAAKPTWQRTAASCSWPFQFGPTVATSTHPHERAHTHTHARTLFCNTKQRAGRRCVSTSPMWLKPRVNALLQGQGAHTRTHTHTHTFSLTKRLAQTLSCIVTPVGALRSKSKKGW